MTSQPAGKNLIIVAAVDNVLHFRIFDGYGEVAVEKDEKGLTEKAQQIEDLKKKLVSLWPPYVLNEDEKSQVVAAVTSIVGHTRFPFLQECPYNLSALNELVKVSDRYASVTDKHKLKELFFQFLLGPNRASHHHPDSQNQVYIRLLEEIANKYAGNVNPHGYFFVTPGDKVNVNVEIDGKPYETQKSTFLVESVLDRSGVAYLNPVNLYVPRYRFYPGWVHEHLFYLYEKRKCEEANTKKGNPEVPQVPLLPKRTRVVHDPDSSVTRRGRDMGRCGGLRNEIGMRPRTCLNRST